MRAGQDLVAAGYVGLKGTAMAAAAKEGRLLERFSRPFVERCKSVECRYGVSKETILRIAGYTEGQTTSEGGVCQAADESRVCQAAGEGGVCQATGESGVCQAADESGVCQAADEGGVCQAAGGGSVCQAAGEGGVLAALWKFLEQGGRGCDIELRTLPILQETVEVCEVFDLNPYRLRSEGCFLLAADNGGDVVRALAAKGIRAAVIGKVSEGPGKRIHNGEIHSFLNRPETDDLYKIL